MTDIADYFDRYPNEGVLISGNVLALNVDWQTGYVKSYLDIIISSALKAL